VNDVVRVPDHGAGGQRAALDDLAEHVRQRQEQQHRTGLVQQLGKDQRHRPDLAEHVAVGQLTALGTPGRAGGVDQRGEVVGADRPVPGVHLVGGDVVAERHQLLDRARGAGSAGRRLDPPDPAQRRRLRGRAVDDGRVLHRLDDDRGRAGVGQDPLDLLVRGRLVDRHGDRAGGQDRVVEQRPLVPGAGQQGDPVPDLDAGRDQPAGHGGDLGGELGRGHVGPLPVGIPAAEDHGRPVLRGVLVDRVDEVLVVADVDGRRDAVLTHGRTLLHTPSIRNVPRRIPEIGPRT
jgi:hypothetical protein